MVTPPHTTPLDESLRRFQSTGKRILFGFTVKTYLLAVLPLPFLWQAYHLGTFTLWTAGAVVVLVLVSFIHFQRIFSFLPLGQHPLFLQQLQRAFDGSRLLDQVVAHLQTQTLTTLDHQFPLSRYQLLRAEPTEVGLDTLTFSTYWLSTEGTVVEVTCRYVCDTAQLKVTPRIRGEKKRRELLAGRPELYHQLFGSPQEVR